jgi:HD-like signal output (HDOD) protein
VAACVALVLQEQFTAVDPLDFQEGAEVLARERQLLETDHCQFGALYATHNQLPGSLIAVMQFHHNPAEAQSYQELVWLVHTADDMANHLQRERTAKGYGLEKSAGWLHLSRSLSRLQNLDMAERARKIMTETEQEGRQGATF